MTDLFGARRRLTRENQILRKVADAAVAEQMCRRAYHRIRNVETQDYDARFELAMALDAAELELQVAVTKYRAYLEDTAPPSERVQAALDRGLQKLDELEGVE